MMQKIFDGQSADGSSSTVFHAGGEVEIIVSGDLGGGTATLEAMYPAVGAWVPIFEGSWDAAGVKILRTIRPCQLRLVLAGSTGASLNAWI